jgi:hypothetical protein
MNQALCDFNPFVVSEDEEDDYDYDADLNGDRSLTDLEFERI